MVCKRSGFIREAIAVAESLDRLAEQGLLDANDDGCALLAGILRDSAYKILRQAEKERDHHRAAGTWEERD